MNKIQTVTGIVIAVFLGVLILTTIGPKNNILGGINDRWSFSSATNTSSTVTTIPALIVTRDATRSFVSICTTDQTAVFICLQTATSTCQNSAGYRIAGVATTTSAGPVCFVSESYKGDIVAISSVTSTVGIVK